MLRNLLSSGKRATFVLLVLIVPASTAFGFSGCDDNMLFSVGIAPSAFDVAEDQVSSTGRGANALPCFSSDYAADAGVCAQDAFLFTTPRSATSGLVYVPGGMFLALCCVATLALCLNGIIMRHVIVDGEKKKEQAAAASAAGDLV